MEKQLKSCFMIMPFRAEFDEIYQEIILPTFDENPQWNLECKRGDDMFTTGSIMQDVWVAIRDASVVIAELTGRNPNVFYELGIAHVLKKPTIMISQSIDDVPFDIRHLRCITYKLGPRALRDLSSKLVSTIDNVIATDVMEVEVFRD